MAEQCQGSGGTNVMNENTELIRINEELELRAQATEERLRISESENTVLKEQLSRAHEDLAVERREKESLQELCVGRSSGQASEKLKRALDTVCSNRIEIETLKAAVERKEAICVKLTEQNNELSRNLIDTKEKLQISMAAKFMVEETERNRAELKCKCDEFYWQVTGLMAKQQESGEEIIFLRREIDHLYAKLEVKEQWIQSATRNLSAATAENDQLRQQIAVYAEEFAVERSDRQQIERGREELGAENMALRDQAQEDRTIMERNQSLVDVLLRMVSVKFERWVPV